MTKMEWRWLSWRRSKLITENWLKIQSNKQKKFVMALAVWQNIVRKKEENSKGKSNDVRLTFETKMKRDLCTPIDCVTQDIKDLSNGIFSLQPI